MHKSYNGLNNFEVKVADAIDNANVPWIRNPSSQRGYSIPIPVYGAESANFKPDFIVWSKKNIWAIDPKGKHLLDTAVAMKMLSIDDLGIRIAFILEGSYVKSGDTFIKDGQIESFTLVWKQSGGVKTRSYKDLDLLISDLVNA